MQPIKNKASEFAAKPAAKATFNGVKTAYRLAEILVPVAMTIYLVMKFDDLLILVLAGALGLFAASKLVKYVWMSVVLQSTKRK